MTVQELTDKLDYYPKYAEVYFKTESGIFPVDNFGYVKHNGKTIILIQK